MSPKTMLLLETELHDFDNLLLFSNKIYFHMEPLDSNMVYQSVICFPVKHSLSMCDVVNCDQSAAFYNFLNL